MCVCVLVMHVLGRQCETHTCVVFCTVLPLHDKVRGQLSLSSVVTFVVFRLSLYRKHGARVDLMLVVMQWTCLPCRLL